MSIEDFTPDDEIVSAYLDGEATAEEIARVQASPELLARVEAFRSTGLAVGAPVAPPPPEVREAAIAAALAASQTAPNVTSLGAAREKKRAFSPRVLALSSAAAAVVIGFIAVVTLADFSSGGDTADQTASVEFADDDAASDAAGGEDFGVVDGDQPADEPAEEPADEAEEEMAEEATALDSADEAVEPQEEMAEEEMAEAEPAEEEAEAPAAAPVPEPTQGPGLFAAAFALGAVNDVELSDQLAVAEDELLTNPSAERGLAFGTCRIAIDEQLSSSESILYVGTALLDGQPIEIYGIGRSSDDLPAPSVWLVDGQSCEIVGQLTR